MAVLLVFGMVKNIGDYNTLYSWAIIIRGRIDVVFLCKQ